MSGGEDHAATGKVKRRGDRSGTDRITLFGTQGFPVARGQVALDADQITCLRLDAREEQQARILADHPGPGHRFAAVKLGVLGIAADFAGGRCLLFIVPRRVIICVFEVFGACRHFQHLNEFTGAVAGIEWQAE